MCELDGWKKEVTVAVVPGLPVDFLIGCDDHLSFAGVISNNSSLPVMTRSQMWRRSKLLLPRWPPVQIVVSDHIKACKQLVLLL